MVEDMTSRDFFGRYGFRDIKIDLYNKDGEKIYTNSYTSFKDATLIIMDEIESAIDDYVTSWKYKGTPYKAEIFTLPTWNLCVVDLITKKKLFNPENY